jgi:hypothetical protein
MEYMKKKEAHNQFKVCQKRPQKYTTKQVIWEPKQKEISQCPNTQTGSTTTYESLA